LWSQDQQGINLSVGEGDAIERDDADACEPFEEPFTDGRCVVSVKDLCGEHKGEPAIRREERASVDHEVCPWRCEVWETDALHASTLQRARPLGAREPVIPDVWRIADHSVDSRHILRVNIEEARIADVHVSERASRLFELCGIAFNGDYLFRGLLRLEVRESFERCGNKNAIAARRFQYATGTTTNGPVWKEARDRRRGVDAASFLTGGSCLGDRNSHQNLR
jgi:hypothetical protein